MRVWDTKLGQCKLVLSGHLQSVTCVKWGGSNLLYTSSHDRTVKVWRADDVSEGRAIEWSEFRTLTRTLPPCSEAWKRSESAPTVALAFLQAANQAQNLFQWFQLCMSCLGTPTKQTCFFNSSLEICTDNYHPHVRPPQMF